MLSPSLHMYVMVHHLFIGRVVYSLSIEHVVNSCVVVVILQSLVPTAVNHYKCAFPKLRQVRFEKETLFF